MENCVEITAVGIQNSNWHKSLIIENVFSDLQSLFVGVMQQDSKIYFHLDKLV